MKKWGIIVLAAMLCTGTAACAATEIMVVDVRQILEESEPGKAASEHIRQVQEILQNSMNEVVKLNEGKDTDAAKNSVAQGRSLLQRQLEIERQAAINVVTAEMNKVVQAWINKNTQGKKDRFLVIPKDRVIGTSANADITRQIIKDMANITPKFADLPKVTITPTKPEGEQATESK